MSGDRDVLLSAITDAIRDHRGGTPLVTEFVLVASWVDEDGAQRIYTDSAEGQRCHTTLGLLDFGATVERHQAEKMWDEDDG